MKTLTITFQMQDGIVIITEARGETHQKAFKAAEDKIQNAFQKGIGHQHAGARLYPPHMIKYAEFS